MKKKLLTLGMTLALSLGLAVVHAQAQTASDAAIYLSKIENIRGSSYLVDFDGDGREELMFSEPDGNGSNNMHVWQGDQYLGYVTDYYAGTMGDDDLLLASRDGKTYLVEYLYGYRENIDEYRFYAVENGKLVEKESLSKRDESYTWSEQLRHSASDHSVVEQLKNAASQTPSVPSDAGPATVPAAAIDALKDVPYCGDRSAIAMDRAQASAILEQMTAYAALTDPVPMSTPGAAIDTYAVLFDTGAGVPGLFMARGSNMPGEDAYISGGDPIYYFGESAIWFFQDGQLVPFAPPGSDGADYFIYPTCVEQYSGAPDGSYSEERFFALNGSFSATPSATIIMTETSASVDGAKVSWEKAEAVERSWESGEALAYAQQGGGVEYLIHGMAPVAQMTAALQNYLAALGSAGSMPIAYASTQSVLVDGTPVEFQCYALKDANGNDTNYIKLRDVALTLTDTDARFQVTWDGTVNIETGKAYTPNGSEMSTPFSGNRAYQNASAPTNINGAPAALEAIVLTDDAGGAYTYYKLRDLGGALGFQVDWSTEQGITIQIR